MIKVKKIVPMQAMEAYAIIQVQLHPFLTSVLYGGKWRTSHPSLLNLYNKPWYEACWAQEFCKREHSLTLARNLSSR
jgi:hypothetical protein